MKNIIYIFLGGGLGSVVRFLISGYAQKLWTPNSFPLGTFLVNILGCFLIGIFFSYFYKSESAMKFLLMAGFCGGFTTFSTFSLESYTLWQNGNYSILIAYVLSSVLLGFLAVILGYWVMK